MVKTIRKLIAALFMISLFTFVIGLVLYMGFSTIGWSFVLVILVSLAFTFCIFWSVWELSGE